MINKLNTCNRTELETKATELGHVFPPQIPDGSLINANSSLDQGADWSHTTTDEADHTPVIDATPQFTVKQLAELPPLEYDKVRVAAATSMGVRPTTLDTEVKAAQKQGAKSGNTASTFDEVELWPTPVDGADLLTAIVATIKRFIICEQHTTVAAALWIVMCWFMDVVQVAPLAVITAPEKACGKTLMLTLIGKLVPRPLQSSNISPAALYRCIDLLKPTLLIDETDACLKNNEELRGLINCGHTRDSAYTVRCVGDDHTPTPFNLWAAKAMAGIGHIADTLMSRAIILELRRKLPTEKVDRIRNADPALFQELSAKLARFAKDNADRVRLARPVLPQSLGDRAQDNWEPLLCIATVASGDWFKIATAAAIKISGSAEQSLTIGEELLMDIQEVFRSLKINRISTTDLIKHLIADNEKLWAGHNKGSQIKPKQIADILKGYKIHSKTVRVGDGTVKGFEKDQFTEAFSCYIPVTPTSPVTESQPPPVEGLQTISSGNIDDPVTDEKTCEPPSIQDCYRVTAKIPSQNDQVIEEPVEVVETFTAADLFLEDLHPNIGEVYHDTNCLASSLAESRAILDTCRAENDMVLVVQELEE
jgi:putative DNA primase/helicase